jgi:hypothetical protein
MPTDQLDLLGALLAKMKAVAEVGRYYAFVMG